jgi:capsid assembly protease
MSNEKMVTVSNTADLRLALAAGYGADQIEIEAPKAIDTDALRLEAAVAERQRIAALHSLAREGFAAELSAAIENGSSPEAFALTLLTEANDRGITLEAIRRDSPKPAPHAKPADAQVSAPRIDHDAIYASRRAAK